MASPRVSESGSRKRSAGDATSRVPSRVTRRRESDTKKFLVIREGVHKALVADNAAALMAATPNMTQIFQSPTGAEGGWTLLHHASDLGASSCVVALLAARADAGAKTKIWRSSPLHRAAKRDRPGAVRALIAAKCDADTKARGGFTPLMDACQHGATSTAAVLLECKADVCAVSSAGRTAAHMAAGYGHLDVLKAVVRARPAVVMAVDKRGHTPEDIAREYGFKGAVAWLSHVRAQKGADAAAPPTEAYDIR